MLDSESGRAILVRRVAVDLWAVAQIGVVACCSVWVNAIISIRYDEMFTLNTAFDPDPSLTKDTVLWNIGINSGILLFAATLVSIVIYYVNDGMVLENEPKLRHLFSRNTAVLSWMAMVFVIVLTGGHYYLKYGASAPWP